MPAACLAARPGLVCRWHGPAHGKEGLRSQLIAAYGTSGSAVAYAWFVLAAPVSAPPASAHTGTHIDTYTVMHVQVTKLNPFLTPHRSDGDLQWGLTIPWWGPWSRLWCQFEL